MLWFFEEPPPPISGNVVCVWALIVTSFRYPKGRHLRNMAQNMSENDRVYMCAKLRMCTVEHNSTLYSVFLENLATQYKLTYLAVSFLLPYHPSLYYYLRLPIVFEDSRTSANWGAPRFSIWGTLRIINYKPKNLS